MRMQSWMPGDKIISYNEFTENPVLIAIEKLKEFGMENKRIGMELSYLSAIDSDLVRRGNRSTEKTDFPASQGFSRCQKYVRV